MKKKGFTLIELMVVIAIIAVLAAVVAPQVFRQVAKGRVASAEAFYNSVKVASTSYFSDVGQWPASCNQTNCNTIAGANGGFVTTGANTAWNGPYLDRWPLAAGNPWGGNYTWVSANNLIFCTACAAAGERYINITLVPLADAQRIDRDKDGAIDGTTGMVRYGAGATPTVQMLISRDGPVN